MDLSCSHQNPGLKETSPSLSSCPLVFFDFCFSLRPVVTTSLRNGTTPTSTMPFWARSGN